MPLVIFKKLTPLLLFLLIVLSLTACGGGGSSSSSGETGTVSVSLTDNDGPYNSVVLNIEKIGIVASNSPTTYYNSSDFSALPVSIDILDLPGEATLFLGNIDIPLPGDGTDTCINQIRLVLADDGNYVVENNDPQMIEHKLKTPSGQQSGVKILVKEETFCLNVENNAVNITIEFDPETAISFNENRANPYQFKPTSLRIIEGSFFTSPESFIDGQVKVPTFNSAVGCEEFDTSPIVNVAAYNSVVLTSKTVAFTDGPFKDQGSCFYSGAFKLLLPDKGTYDIEAEWRTFYAEKLSVPYNTTVVLDLTD